MIIFYFIKIDIVLLIYRQLHFYLKYDHDNDLRSRSLSLLGSVLYIEI